MTPSPYAFLRSFVTIGVCGLNLAGSALGANRLPRLIQRVEPVYPAAMSERAEDGYGEVSFIVDEVGHTADVKLKRASDPAFGDAAIAAVKTWTYHPATQNGRSVRSARQTEMLKIRAPWNVKLGPLCGRKVFVELKGPVLDEEQLGGTLRLVGHWRPPSPDWIKVDRVVDRSVSISFVISADGQVVNPEIDDAGNADETFAALCTLMLSRWDPPVLAGEAANVRIRRTLTMKAGSRQWTLPDPVVKPAGPEVSVEQSGVLGLLDHRPIVISRPEPVFSHELRRKGARGAVEVEFVVTSQGDVAGARIVRSTRPEFEEPVLAAVRRWKFEPGVKSGRRVNTRMRQTVTFDVHWD